jgi:DNA-binding LacI/PurR family transcriptional regulator
VNTIKDTNDTSAQNNFLYEDIINSIIELIRKEQLSLGDKLPSERQLSERFNCNYHTIRKAVRILSEQGILEKRPRQGNYVRQDPEFMIGQPQSRIKIVSTRKIGVFALSCEHEFSTRLLLELENQASEMNVQLEVSGGHQDGRNSDIFERFTRNDCRSVIIVDVRESNLLGIIESSPLPVVTARGIPGKEEFCHEPPEYYGHYSILGIELLCRYFLALGFEYIAYLGGVEMTGLSPKKFINYNNFMNNHNMQSISRFVSSEASELDSFIASLQKFRGRIAVICDDDIFGMRLINAFHKNSWTLPDDAAVAGFNNFYVGKYTDPLLTTIQFPYKYLAKSLLMRAIDLGEGCSGWRDRKIPVPELIIRESCGGIKVLGDNVFALKTKLSAEINKLSESY